MNHEPSPEIADLRLTVRLLTERVETLERAVSKLAAESQAEAPAPAPTTP